MTKKLNTVVFKDWFIYKNENIALSRAASNGFGYEIVEETEKAVKILIHNAHKICGDWEQWIPKSVIVSGMFDEEEKAETITIEYSKDGQQKTLTVEDVAKIEERPDQVNVYVFGKDTPKYILKNLTSYTISKN